MVRLESPLPELNSFSYPPHLKIINPSRPFSMTSRTNRNPSSTDKQNQYRYNILLNRKKKEKFPRYRLNPNHLTPTFPSPFSSSPFHLFLPRVTSYPSASVCVSLSLLTPQTTSPTHLSSRKEAHPSHSAGIENCLLTLRTPRQRWSGSRRAW